MVELRDGSARSRSGRFEIEGRFDACSHRVDRGREEERGDERRVEAHGAPPEVVSPVERGRAPPTRRRETQVDHDAAPDEEADDGGVPVPEDVREGDLNPAPPGAARARRGPRGEEENRVPGNDLERREAAQAIEGSQAGVALGRRVRHSLAIARF